MKKAAIATILLIIVLTILLLCLAACKAEESGTPFTCVVHKGECVWVRDQPSKDAEKIDSIRYGYSGLIFEIMNGYARVETTYGIKGWVDVSYLEIPIDEEIWVIQTKDPLNKRETPGGRYMTRIKGGSRISVLGWRYDKNGELWAKVYHGGYVKAEFLAKAEQ